MTIPKYCILCENYKQHPCCCTHCEDFDEFIVSESGKHLILTMSKQYEKEKIIEELEKIREEIKINRDEWIKGQDAEWHTYDRCLVVIDKHISELKGE